MLTRFVLGDLVREQTEQGRAPLLARQDDVRRQRLDQSSAELALVLVGADEEHRRSVRVVAPRSHAEIHLLAEVVPIGCRAVLARMDHHLGRGRRIVREHIRLVAPQERDVASHELIGSPRSGTTHASPRTIATSESGASSCTRTDHGGLMSERSRNAPRARGPSRSPSSASIRLNVDD